MEVSQYFRLLVTAGVGEWIVESALASLPRLRSRPSQQQSKQRAHGLEPVNRPRLDQPVRVLTREVGATTLYGVVNPGECCGAWYSFANGLWSLESCVDPLESCVDLLESCVDLENKEESVAKSDSDKPDHTSSNGESREALVAAIKRTQGELNALVDQLDAKQLELETLEGKLLSLDENKAGPSTPCNNSSSPSLPEPTTQSFLLAKSLQQITTLKTIVEDEETDFSEEFSKPIPTLSPLSLVPREQGGKVFEPKESTVVVSTYSFQAPSQDTDLSSCSLSSTSQSSAAGECVSVSSEPQLRLSTIKIPVSCSAPELTTYTTPELVHSQPGCTGDSCVPRVAKLEIPEPTETEPTTPSYFLAKSLQQITTLKTIVEDEETDFSEEFSKPTPTLSPLSLVPREQGGKVFELKESTVVASSYSFQAPRQIPSFDSTTVSDSTSELIEQLSTELVAAVAVPIEQVVSVTDLHSELVDTTTDPPSELVDTTTDPPSELVDTATTDLPSELVDTTTDPPSELVDTTTDPPSELVDTTTTDPPSELVDTTTDLPSELVDTTTTDLPSELVDTATTDPPSELVDTTTDLPSELVDTTTDLLGKLVDTTATGLPSEPTELSLISENGDDDLAKQLSVGAVTETREALVVPNESVGELPAQTESSEQCEDTLDEPSLLTITESSENASADNKLRENLVVVEIGEDPIEEQLSTDTITTSNEATVESVRELDEQLVPQTANTEPLELLLTESTEESTTESSEPEQDLSTEVITQTSSNKDDTIVLDSTEMSVETQDCYAEETISSAEPNLPVESAQREEKADTPGLLPVGRPLSFDRETYKKGLFTLDCACECNWCRVNILKLSPLPGNDVPFSTCCIKKRSSPGLSNRNSQSASAPSFSGVVSRTLFSPPSEPRRSYSCVTKTDSPLTSSSKSQVPPPVSRRGQGRGRGRGATTLIRSDNQFAATPVSRSSTGTSYLPGLPRQSKNAHAKSSVELSEQLDDPTSWPTLSGSSKKSPQIPASRGGSVKSYAWSVSESDVPRKQSMRGRRRGDTTPRRSSNKSAAAPISRRSTETGHLPGLPRRSRDTNVKSAVELSERVDGPTSWPAIRGSSKKSPHIPAGKGASVKSHTWSVSESDVPRKQSMRGRGRRNGGRRGGSSRNFGSKSSH